MLHVKKVATLSGLLYRFKLSPDDTLAEMSDAKFADLDGFGNVNSLAAALLSVNQALPFYPPISGTFKGESGLMPLFTEDPLAIAQFKANGSGW